MDRYPSNAVYEDTRARYDRLLKSGNVDEPLVGNGGSTVAANFRSCSRKRTAEESVMLGHFYLSSLTLFDVSLSLFCFSCDSYMLCLSWLLCCHCLPVETLKVQYR